jgi:hypothetical protein
VQVVYFDENATVCLPCSARARTAKVGFSAIRTAFESLLDLQHRFGDLQEKPAGMSDLAFRGLREAAEWLEIYFLLAASGVPEPISMMLVGSTS